MLLLLVHVMLVRISNHQERLILHCERKLRESVNLFAVFSYPNSRVRAVG